MLNTPIKANDISEILQKKTEYQCLFYVNKRKYSDLCTGFY